MKTASTLVRCCRDARGWTSREIDRSPRVRTIGGDDADLSTPKRACFVSKAKVVIEDAGALAI